MKFTEELINIFNTFEESPMLFIGSGMSRRYINLENWPDLLKKFTNKINENHTKINADANSDLPEYASVLAEIYHNKWWDIPENKLIQEKYSSEFKNRQSVLKIEISEYLKSVDFEILEKFKKYENEINLLRKVTIDGIITTNWDLFLEYLFPEFTVFIGQHELLTGRSQNISEIYKIHGCSSKPNSLVLTSDDYNDYRKKNPYLCAKLLTIFVERPVIFLGYSLDDKHIAEIFDDIINCLPKENIDFLKNKLIFVQWEDGKEESTITDSIIHKKIPVKLIQKDNYSELFEVLGSRKRRIPAHIFRIIKEQIYNLVITNDPKGLLYVTDEDLDKHQAVNEFVVGVGAISKVKKAEEMQRQGLLGLKRIDIVHEVIFEDRHYNAQDIVTDVLPEHCKGRANIPIFYYLNKAGYFEEGNTLNINTKLKSKIRININVFQNKTEKRLYTSSKLAKYESISQLYKEDKKHFFSILPYMKMDLIKNELDFLLDVLKDDFDSNLNSNFVRAVCVYDFIKYRL